MTQTLMPKSAKVAQIQLPERNSRQNSPSFVSQKGSNFEHPKIPPSPKISENYSKLQNFEFFGIVQTLRAQRLKRINIAWNLQSRLKISISLENFNLDLQNSTKKKFGGRLAWNFQSRLKFQSQRAILEFFQSLEDRNLLK